MSSNRCRFRAACSSTEQSSTTYITRDRTWTNLKAPSCHIIKIEVNVDRGRNGNLNRASGRTLLSNHWSSILTDKLCDNASEKIWYIFRMTKEMYAGPYRSFMQKCWLNTTENARQSQTLDMYRKFLEVIALLYVPSLP